MSRINSVLLTTNPKDAIANDSGVQDNTENDDCVKCENEPQNRAAPHQTIPSSIEERAKELYHGEGLGPMVRASTIPLRSLAYKYGADFAYTEELIDRSLSNTQRVVNTELGTVDYIKFDPHNHTRITTTRRKLSKGHDSLLILRIDPTLERHRLVCQLGTGNAQHAVQAAIHVHQDVAAIDINMGCPKKFSTGGGMGSALLQDPGRASEIIRTISNTLSTSYLGSIDTGSCNASNEPQQQQQQQPKPVSAKIRLLPTIQGTIDFITALVNAGVHAIAIHGRHVGNPDVENADWDELYTVMTMVISKFPRIQFLINGDFYTRYEFTNFIQQTGVAGVLLARPALHNTSIFIKPEAQPDTNLTTGMIPGTTGSNDCRIPLTSQSVLYGYDSPLLLDQRTVIQEYLQEAIRYDGHYKNVKYVICEMMNLRRAPHARVPYLNRPQNTALNNSTNKPTIGTTCAQNSIEELCQVWNVKYSQHVAPNHKNPTSLSTALPDERTYSDSYLLQQHEQQPKGQLR